VSTYYGLVGLGLVLGQFSLIGLC